MIKRNKFIIISAVLGLFVFVGLGCSKTDPATNLYSPDFDREVNQEEMELDIQELNEADNNEDMNNDTNEELVTESGSEKPPVPTKPVGILPPHKINDKIVRIFTDKGEIVFKVYAEDAPKTVSNFVALAESGYYDGLTFHRVEPGFVIQGGDPLGNGMGGPGYKFEDEPVTRDYLDGTVAMANAGPDTNGSQFFICLGDQKMLPKNYTIFGQVVSGMETVRSISVGDKMNQVIVDAAN